MSSDTYILMNDKTFQEHLLARDFKSLYAYMGSLGFRGVMLINNEDFSEIYGIAAGKTIKFFKSEVLIMISNEKIYSPVKELGDGVYMFSLDGSVEALH